ncbi:MAG TPA: PQQ-binding-like beta-propeller repeat protein [Thermoanaerobaculia bacterium]|nr:PQQ-binding-like beta-propeller repeat protein [Thermoanaerobaculia bacterium]
MTTRIPQHPAQPSSPRRSAPLALLAACALVVPLAATAENADWPAFRGRGSQGVVSGVTLPTTWNVETGETVRWKTEVPGLGHSSPVVWGNRVFLTTAVRAEGEESLKVGLYGDIQPVADDSPHSFQVLALDLATGKILWTRTAYEGVPEVKRHTKASHANSTPATDGEHLVVMFGSEGLYCYDLEGELLWSKDFGVLDSGFFMVPTAQWGFASSPLIHDGKVYIQADVQGQSFLAAFDVTTGEQVWRTDRDEVPTWSTPAIAPRGDGWQVVVNGWKHIGGYAAETGEELWKITGGGDIPVPTPIVAGDLILITSAHGRERPIYAIETSATGEITVESEAMAWHQEKAGNYMQTPIVVGDLAYFGFDNGVISVYEVETGKRLYQERLGGGQTGFTASPVAGDGKVYFTSEVGDTYVLKHGRELELLATNELGETFMSTPAIAGDQILFRARHHLIAVGE